MSTNDPPRGSRQTCEVWPESGLLHDFPIPPEVEAVIAWHCRRRGYTKRGRVKVEQDLKLQYYFGGQTVYARRTPQGLQILAHGDPCSQDLQLKREQFQGLDGLEFLQRLTPPWQRLPQQRPAAQIKQVKDDIADGLALAGLGDPGRVRQMVAFQDRAQVG